jgi:hypothetical protein
VPAHALCGCFPSRTWVYRFLSRHREIKLSKPAGLDPKRAKAFNFAAINHHFELLGNFLRECGIPWENIYNMDEVGAQRGGGRKGGGNISILAISEQITRFEVLISS